MPRVRIVLFIALIIAFLGLAAGIASRTQQGGFDPFYAWVPSSQLPQLVICPPGSAITPDGLHVTQTRLTWPGALVLFRITCAPASGQPPFEMVGDHTFQLTWSGWQSMGGSSGKPISTQQHVRAIHVSRDSGDDGTYTLVSGLISPSEMSRIEVVFGDGQHHFDTVRNEMFGIVRAGIVGVCEVRVWDRQGQLVQRVDLQGYNQTAQQAIPVDCQP